MKTHFTLCENILLVTIIRVSNFIYNFAQFQKSIDMKKLKFTFYAFAAALLVASCGNKKVGQVEEQPAYESKFDDDLSDKLCSSQDPYSEEFVQMIEQIGYAMDDAEHYGDIERWVKNNIVEARNAQYMARMISLEVNGDMTYSDMPADQVEPAKKVITRFDSIKALAPVYEFNLEKVYDGPMQPSDYIKFAEKVGVPVDSLVLKRLEKVTVGFEDDYEY